MKIDTLKYNYRKKKKVKQNSPIYLYASPVGKTGKAFLAKIIQKFGYNDFDYLIFVYDDAKFDEDVFRGCTFIYEKGLKWEFAKKYLTPDRCIKYDYIFFWDDDIDIDDFSYENFIEIAKRNNLEMFQPALNHLAYPTHQIILKDKKYKIGRFTDYVEIMTPVFSNGAWCNFFRMIEEDYNFWGWGYEGIAKSFCEYKNMGIVDCETVIHTRKPQAESNTIAEKERAIFLERHKEYKIAYKVRYGKLK